MDNLVGVQVGQAAQDLSANVGNPFFFQTLAFGGCLGLKKQEKKNQDIPKENSHKDYVTRLPLLTDGSDTYRPNQRLSLSVTI